jgi:plastocyanin
VPSAKADALRAKRQLDKAISEIKKLAKQAPPAGDVIQAGPDSKSGSALLRFTPAEKTVKVGTPVTLTMTPGSAETHTFTFARELTSLKPLTDGFISPLPGTGTGGPPLLGLAAQGVYPSDVPVLPPYDGTQRGNGFLNTGALDGDPKSPLPLSSTVTFSAPGTYPYLCVIHPEMVGKVVVTA